MSNRATLLIRPSLAPASAPATHTKAMSNYFEFFNLPLSPKVDKALLKKTFYANSKRFHPDFHTLKGAEEQDEAMEKSTLNNQGYKILNNPDKALKHLLELKGTLGVEGSNSVPQDFLMEIMDVNEALMELEFDGDPAAKEKLQTLIDNLETELEQSVADLVNQYDDATVSPADLEKLKDYYLKKRYLLRLRSKGAPEM